MPFLRHKDSRDVAAKTYSLATRTTFSKHERMTNLKLGREARVVLAGLYGP